MNNFKLINQLTQELNLTNSNNDKKETLSKSIYNTEFVKEILKATHNPFVQYNVTSKNLKKRSDLIASESKYINFFDLLESLSSMSITGHEAIEHTNRFIEDHKEYADIIYNVFDRNLKTRCSEKIINKVFDDLIPTFDVALANKYDEKTAKKVDFINDIWYASRKLDGLRCICICRGTDVKFYSRSGKEFKTLEVVRRAIAALNLTTVFDGEICIVDENGNEDFQAILKEYNKKGHTILNPRYKIFDNIDLSDFLNKKGTKPLGERIESIKTILENNNNPALAAVDQWVINSEEHLVQSLELAEENGWEGLMIRKNVGYEGKRTNNLLKCKKMHDAEYVVDAVDVGPFRVIVDGIEVTENILRNISITHKGANVDVGSGFSINQRRLYKENPELIIGKTVTVQYFEETIDRNGKPSLRFPVLKAIYENGRDV